jgi:hypothetical protein
MAIESEHPLRETIESTRRTEIDLSGNYRLVRSPNQGSRIEITPSKGDSNVQSAHFQCPSLIDAASWNDRSIDVGLTRDVPEDTLNTDSQKEIDRAIHEALYDLNFERRLEVRRRREQDKKWDNMRNGGEKIDDNEIEMIMDDRLKVDALFSQREHEIIVECRARFEVKLMLNRDESATSILKRLKQTSRAKPSVPSSRPSICSSKSSMIDDSVEDIGDPDIELKKNIDQTVETSLSVEELESDPQTWKISISKETPIPIGETSSKLDGSSKGNFMRCEHVDVEIVPPENGRPAMDRLRELTETLMISVENPTPPSHMTGADSKKTESLTSADHNVATNLASLGSSPMLSSSLGTRDRIEVGKWGILARNNDR